MARLISVLAINLLILLSTPAYAKSIGSITDFKGAGQIKRSAQTIPASRNLPIEKMDTVSTTSQGRFGISFIDGTKVSVTENSRLVIDDFVFDGGASPKGRLGLKVALGTVRYASGAIAHGNARGVNIRTPTATIGVRGTDFVMSVDEIGRTMIVLLPNCFDEKDPGKAIDNCPVGSIEVATAAGSVTLNQPFQATVIENSSVPPSPPTTVNLTGQQISNSMQISPPQTTGGVNIIQQARSDLKAITAPALSAADNNADPSVGNIGDASPTETAVVVAQAASDSLAIIIDQPLLVAVEPVLTTASDTAKKTTYSNVSPLYEKQVQIGWVYSILSPSKLHIASIWQSKDTDNAIAVTQDGITDSYNFSGATWPTSGTGRPQGNITINQSTGAR